MQDGRPEAGDYRLEAEARGAEGVLRTTRLGVREQ